MSKDQRTALDQQIRQTPRGGETLEERRASFEKMLTSKPLPEDVETTPSTLGGVPVVDVDLTGIKSDDVVLFLHGGAYVMGSATSVVGLQPISAGGPAAGS